MKPSLCLRVLRFLAALISAAALCGVAQAQDRVALVVGNSKYINANIVPNAVNDARVMARTLREIGFGVTDGFDLNRDGMERQIREFLLKSESARVALFFYAGQRARRHARPRRRRGRDPRPANPLLIRRCSARSIWPV